MKPDSDSNSHKIVWQNRKFRIYRESSKGSWRTFFRIKGTLYHCTLETHLKAAAIERALNEIIKPALNGGKPRQEEKLEPVTIPGTFGAVVDLYKQWALIEPHSIRANYHAAWRIIAATHDRFKRYSGAPLTVLTPKLAEAYQLKMIRIAEAAAEPTATARRDARLKAQRTSKSTIQQAKSLFAKKGRFVERYTEAGITIPDCVLAFREFQADGTNRSKRYVRPSDKVIAETFEKADALKKIDKEAWLMFWMAVGTGMRRGELATARGEHFRTVDARLHVVGGTGKDGEEIVIPVQKRTQDVLQAEGLLKEGVIRAGLIFEGSEDRRYDKIPAILNDWLNSMGWTGRKKMHDLRAYVGSKLYERNPRAAMLFLRHKNLAVTEQYYSHHAARAQVDDVI
jgi:integrase